MLPFAVITLKESETKVTIIVNNICVEIPWLPFALSFVFLFLIIFALRDKINTCPSNHIRMTYFIYFLLSQRYAEILIESITNLTFSLKIHVKYNLALNIDYNRDRITLSRIYIFNILYKLTDGCIVWDSEFYVFFNNFICVYRWLITIDKRYRL